MNAIGVKAAPDGFPTVGGTEEVTHYGMYDRTEDFVSGGEFPTKHAPTPAASRSSGRSRSVARRSSIDCRPPRCAKDGDVLSQSAGAEHR